MASSASAKLWLFFVPRIMEIAFYRRTMNRRIESLIRTVWKVKTDSSIERNGRRNRPMLNSGRKNVWTYTKQRLRGRGVFKRCSN